MKDRKRLVVVLGMHRSGTSLITRALLALGVNLGDNLLPPIQGDNETGFWEDVDILGFNVELLKHLQCDWHTLTPIDFDILNTKEMDHFILRAVEILKKKTERFDVFGIKDPRMARLMPFWKKVFKYVDVDVFYIIAVRNPLSVIKSLDKRNHFEIEKSSYLWLTHVVPSILDSEGHRRVVVDYDLFMNNPELGLSRIAHGIGSTFDNNAIAVRLYLDSFISDRLRHTEYTLGELSLSSGVPRSVVGVYEILVKLATDTLTEDSEDVSIYFKKANAEILEMRPLLEYVTRKESELLDTQVKIQKIEEYKDKIILELTESLSQEKQYGANVFGKTQSLMSQIQLLETEKNILMEQLEKQRETFFDQYTKIQKEIAVQISVLHDKNILLREKDLVISNLEKNNNQQVLQLQLKEQDVLSLRNKISLISSQISQKEEKIVLMEASKFWKLRGGYLRSKWAIQNPFKFIRKYLWKNMPRLGRKKVALYVASTGNYFFREILLLVKEGFSELGYSVTVKDEQDEFGGDYDWHVVVAPHEFFFNGNGWRLREGVWPHNTILINLEQPNLQWFKMVEMCMHKAYAIWDINYESVQIFIEKNLRAMFLPLGYTQAIEKNNKVLRIPENQLTESLDIQNMLGDFQKTCFADRPIDICFIGVLSDRRDKFFAQYGAFFSKYNCYFYFWPGATPMITGTNTSMDTITAQGIIQRSKILLNIHQGEHPYFEWHRIVNQGIANKTLVVSENCTHGDQIIPGEDFIAGSLDDLPDLIEKYLTDTSNAQAVIDSAYFKFKTLYSMKKILKEALNKLEELT